MVTSTANSGAWTYDRAADCLRDEMGRVVVANVGPAGQQIAAALNARLADADRLNFLVLAQMVVALGQQCDSGYTLEVPMNRMVTAPDVAELMMYDRQDGVRVLGARFKR